MKLPRDINGSQLVKELSVMGYQPTRQKGSHIRVTTQQDGENHEATPYHRPIKAGTLAAILKRVATHHRMDVDELLKLLAL